MRNWMPPALRQARKNSLDRSMSKQAVPAGNGRFRGSRGDHDRGTRKKSDVAPGGTGRAAPMGPAVTKAGNERTIASGVRSHHTASTAARPGNTPSGKAAT